MANSCQNYHFCPYLFSVLLTCLPQVISLLTLGRDTLKTIAGNETYHVGYRTSKYPQHRTYFYGVSSGVGLLRLAKQELKMYNAAVEAFSTSKTSTKTASEKMIHEYLEDYDETSAFLMEGTTGDENKASKVAGDLIGAFRMVRRFRNYIQRGLCEDLAGLNSSQFINTLKPLSTQGPFKEDIHLAIFAIIFTQLQFDWSPIRISTGTIKGMELGTTLRAIHCLELGVHAVASGIYSVGIDWLELATIKIQNGDPSADLNLTLNLLQQAKAKHDNLWRPEPFRSLNATFFAMRLNDTSENGSRLWQRSFAFESSYKLHADVGQDRSWDICTGRREQTEKTKSELFCWHESLVHASWKIRPLKAELLASVPFQIVQFHSVLGSRKSEQIISRSDAVLHADKLGTKKYFDRKLRLCESIIVSSAELDILTQRITGLLSSGGKSTPMSLYPPGGHTGLHIDSIGRNYPKRSIGTLMYFLEGPEIGGEVIFPLARVAAKPLKGSAILWYNLLKSSEFDYETMHGSCSSVKGLKKIATHLLSDHLQAHLTCDKEPDSKWKYLFNGKSKL